MRSGAKVHVDELCGAEADSCRGYRGRCNAGSDYLFVPDGNIETVKAAVVCLQSRLQFGAIFVSDRHGEIAGTLPMSRIKTESSASGRAPDIIVSFSYDQNVAVAGKSGVSYASSVNRRGSPAW